MINLQINRNRLIWLFLAALTICALLITVHIFRPFSAAQTKPKQRTLSTQSTMIKPKHQPDLNTSSGTIHKNVITTVFWVGEIASDDNGYISNEASAWDEQWKQNYGGEDNPSGANSFTPKQNSFYVALPYNDIDQNGNRKATAEHCPNATNVKLQNYSWCKNSWLAINSLGRTVYAQWEDVGPYQEDDVAYVFESSLPKNKSGSAAGLDISPAVRDYLGVGDVSRASWRFVSPKDVPAGPWKRVITTSPGDLVE